VKVSVTIEFTENARRAINKYYGRDGKANTEDCQRFIIGTINATLEDVEFEAGEE
jgi:hypothetical protein